MIKFCTCRHDFQDSRYGKGKRVMNAMKKEGSYRCTVCERECSGPTRKILT